MKIVWQLKLRIPQWKMFRMMTALKQQALLCNSLCFSNNQLASKAKDSFENRKKKGSGGSNKKKNSGFLCGENSR